MDYQVKSTSIEKLRSTCLVLPVFDNKKLSAFAAAVDTHYNGGLKQFLKLGDMTGKAQQTAVYYPNDKTACDRILLVGCGKEKDIDSNSFRKTMAAAWSTLAKLNCKQAHLAIFDINVKDKDDAWRIRTTIEAIADKEYCYTQTKKSDNDDATSCSKITFIGENLKGLPALKKGITQGNAISAGIALCKNLSDLPGNVCTPSYLAATAKKLKAGDTKFSVEVLTEAQMDKLGMGSLLSVSRGSREPAKLIVVKYMGGKKADAPIVLVGKGLTFDAGGISLKPAGAMDEMKYDMCGGASVFGTLKACKDMALPVNVIGIVPSSENLPDGEANKPGDVVTSMSGQTIEILNTDAEGRLILCDALTYCHKFKPKMVIDIATLTGACIVALGNQASGVLGNDQGLVDKLIEAGESTDDRCWQLPLWDGYQDQLKSNFADIANIGGKGAGTITAACFLSRFTEELSWAHLDIAGTAWRSGGTNKGATGRPVSLLTQFIMNQA